MNNEILSAEEFFNQYCLEEYDEGGYLGLNEKEGSKMLIEFAKLHVTEALRQAANKAASIQNPDTRKYVNKKAIMNSYLLENIK